MNYINIINIIEDEETYLIDTIPTIIPKNINFEIEKIYNNINDKNNSIISINDFKYSHLLMQKLKNEKNITINSFQTIINKEIGGHLTKENTNTIINNLTNIMETIDLVILHSIHNNKCFNNFHISNNISNVVLETYKEIYYKNFTNYEISIYLKDKKIQ